ncbi:hypothetical protein Ciccas_009427 [Cichlidogyrus casuarinus]|uniref:Sodium/calcium exchanger membrane region domain-containing protein n=1 Tax=Cichlidogyrus casuarinus TaxID=1844966 RepID=A0ABD2PX32_9PLAT
MSFRQENYTHGQISYWNSTDNPFCESWLLLPGENLWNRYLRVFLYLTAMLYIFVGIAIVSDIFMGAIERITALKRSIMVFDEATSKVVSREVFVWNETVANLTLMAFGSSAPEILLATVESFSGFSNIDNGQVEDSLGLFTIIGSAAFNLLIINGICILSVPSPTYKRIKEFGVFLMTATWSLFAYAWLLITTVVISPGVIELWEACLTFLFFPSMVLLAYAQDNGWWINKRPVLEPGRIIPVEDKNQTQLCNDVHPVSAHPNILELISRP